MIYKISIICLFFIIPLHAMMGNSFDSLRVEKIKGSKFIVHRVDSKETLYSISKRYGTSIDQIKEYNKFLNNGLKMFDEILIPLSKKKKKDTPEVVEKITPRSYHVVKKGETLFAISRRYNISVDSLARLNHMNQLSVGIGDTIYISPKVQIQIKGESLKSTGKTHIVLTSETLFGISKMYQVEIEQIQKWNNLSDYSISIGQELIVAELDEQTKQKNDVSSIIEKREPKKKAELDTLYVKTDYSQFKTQTKSENGITKVTEDGFAMKIEDTEYTKKYLALHRIAPLGSVIYVKNQMTNITIEARVVGKLPMSSLNQTLILRLSDAAFDKLGALDLKIPVIVSHAKN